jgi:hypothetical protein
MAAVRDEILKKILDSITVTSEGNISWEGIQDIEYMRYTSLILSELMADSNFEKRLDYLRYSFSNEDDISLFGDPLTTIFKEMKLEKKYTFSEFEEKLDIKLNEIHKSKVETFEIYYPVNINAEDKIDPIKFKDVSIEVKDYNEVKDQINKVFENEDSKANLESNNFEPEKYKYARIKVWARNYHYAEKIATKHLELLLGFLVYSQNYGRITVRIIGFPKELSLLRIYYAFLFNEGQFKLTFYYEDRVDGVEIYKLKKEDVENLNKLATAFNLYDQKKQDITYKSIISYYNGMTEKSVEYSFMNFWKSFEIISLKEKNIPHAEIIKILKSMLKDLTPLEEHRIDRLYSLRNNLIHGGSAYNNITQDDRNLLKIYVELMIKFFMFHIPAKYDVREIQMIYQFLEKDTAFLEKSKSLIDFVINLDKGDSK